MDCHDSGGVAGAQRQWLFGGTVFQSDGTTAAAHVEVAVTDGTNTYTTYSATNGNFWVPASQGTLNWTSARAIIRNANGETSMTDTPQAGCNNCHNGTVQAPITEP
jgi:hypothetical protein